MPTTHPDCLSLTEQLAPAIARAEPDLCECSWFGATLGCDYCRAIMPLHDNTMGALYNFNFMAKLGSTAEEDRNSKTCPFCSHLNPRNLCVFPVPAPAKRCSYLFSLLPRQTSRLPGPSHYCCAQAVQSHRPLSIAASHFCCYSGQADGHSSNGISAPSSAIKICSDSSMGPPLPLPLSESVFDLIPTHA